MSSRIKNQTSFQRDKYKRIMCHNCGRFISESHLGEKKTREKRCLSCGTINIISPPRLTKFEGKNCVRFGGSESSITFTPELQADE